LLPSAQRADAHSAGQLRGFATPRRRRVQSAAAPNASRSAAAMLRCVGGTDPRLDVSGGRAQRRVCLRAAMLSRVGGTDPRSDVSGGRDRRRVALRRDAQKCRRHRSTLGRVGRPPPTRVAPRRRCSAVSGGRAQRRCLPAAAMLRCVGGTDRRFEVSGGRDRRRVCLRAAMLSRVGGTDPRSDVSGGRDRRRVALRRDAQMCWAAASGGRVSCVVLGGG
jgi:hypothetical protein